MLYNKEEEDSNTPWWANLKVTRWDAMEGLEGHALACLEVLALKENKTIHWTNRINVIIDDLNIPLLFEKLEDCNFLNLYKVIYSGSDYKEANWVYGSNRTALFLNIWKGNVNFTLFGLNKKEFIVVRDILKEFIYSEFRKTKGSIYTPLSTRGGLQFKKIGSGGKELIKENYTKEIIENFEYTTQQLSSKDPDGRLLILQGPPGTGKSYFIRGILEEVENTVFIVISADQVSHLMDPSFIPALLDLKDQVGTTMWSDELESIVEKKVSITLVVEDADDILVSRDRGNMTAVSTLLNFADGIMGENLDIRIITSTNANLNFEEFDSALTRPGRLLKMLRLEPLGRQQAIEIYDRLTESQNGVVVMTKESYTLAEIYGIAKGYNSGDTKSEKRKVGFA